MIKIIPYNQLFLKLDGLSLSEIDLLKDILKFSDDEKDQEVFFHDDDKNNEEDNQEYQVYLNNEDGFFVLSGLKNYLISQFTERGIDFEDHFEQELKMEYEPITDKYYLDCSNDGERKFELRDYQISSANKALLFQRGILEIPTRGGKTEIVLAAMKRFREKYPESKCLLVSFSSWLMLQSYNRCLQRGFTSVGRLSGEYNEIEGNYIISAVIDSLYNSVKKFHKTGERDEIYRLLEEVEFIFFDEVHMFGAVSNYSTFLECKNVKMFIGVSGTPFVDRIGPYSNIRDAFVVGYTGGLIQKISYQYLVERGYLADTHVFFLSYEFKTPRYFIYSYRKVYEYYIVENRNRNALAVEIAEKFFENGLTCLLLVKRLAHGRELLKRISLFYKDVKFIYGGPVVEGIVDGEVKELDNFPIMEKFNKGEIKILIGSDVIATGIDFPALDAAILLRGEGVSYIPTLQTVARATSPNSYENKAFIVDFVDSIHAYLARHSSFRLRDYYNRGYKVHFSINELVDMIREVKEIRERMKNTEQYIR